ncbi:MAG: acyltransferase [Bdellovibrio sp.]|nr:acyltransferase [Bdellovibrio sp.]
MQEKSQSPIHLIGNHLAALTLGGGLFTLLMGVNFIQMSSLLVFPFHRKLFRKINSTCAGGWWGLCETVLRRIRKIEVIVTGDTIPFEENALIICNHQSMSDIPALFKTAKAAGRLGDMKWFVKDVLKYVPGVGWGMLFLDCIFVKRNWHADKDKIYNTFKKFYTHQIPIWPMLFPEGTRLRPHKLKKVQEICKKKSLPETTHVLLPRPKGFIASVQGLRGHLKSVIDVTIGYEGQAPSLYDLLLGKARRLHLYIKRIPINTLPESEKELEAWIIKCFYDKDLRLRKFQESLCFSNY